MTDIRLHITKYLEYCSQQKRLDKKTIKAYRIDLDQFANYISETQLADITQDTLELYISYLHQNYQPKTVKRKQEIIRTCKSSIIFVTIFSNHGGIVYG